MPTTLKIVRGNPGRRALNSDEPSSPLLKRMPPALRFIDDDGRRVWSAEGRRLIRARLLTALDPNEFRRLGLAEDATQGAIPAPPGSPVARGGQIWHWGEASAALRRFYAPAVRFALNGR